MGSRSLEDLQPGVRECAHELLASAEQAGLDVLIYCTLRPLEEQAKLFRNGRALHEIQAKADELNSEWGRPDLAQLLMEVGPQYGAKVVTWAGPGQSLHNYGLAFDSVPMLHGKAMWGKTEPDDRRRWHLYGELGEAAGLEWAGHWRHHQEFPHLQASGVDWRDLIKG